MTELATSLTAEYDGVMWVARRDGVQIGPRFTFAHQALSALSDSVSDGSKGVGEIVREIEILLDNCHWVEGIDIAAQHEAVMALVHILSARAFDSGTVGQQPVSSIEAAPKDGTVILGITMEAQSPAWRITWWDGEGWVRVWKPEKFVMPGPARWWPTHWVNLPPASPTEPKAGVVSDDMVVAALKGLVLLKDLFDASDRNQADAYYILAKQDGAWGNARSALTAALPNTTGEAE